MVIHRFIAVIAVLMSTQAVAQTKPACADAAYRALDFWVGEWTVTNADGKPAGKSSVKTILDGCVITENWSSSGSAYAGMSVNTWDPQSKKWTQDWVDNTGMRAVMTGEFAGRD